MKKRVTRRALYGWYFYILPVVVIIGVLGYDAYLNIETRRNDYEIAKLKRRAGELNEAIEKLRSHAASSHQLKRIEEKAAEMGMAEVAPWQVERIALVEPLRSAEEFDVAAALPVYVPQPQPRHDEEVVLAAQVPLPVPSVEAVESSPAVVAGGEDPELMLDIEVAAPAAHVAQLTLSTTDAPGPMRRETEHTLSVPLDDAPAMATLDEELHSLDDSVESMLATL